MNGRSRPRRTGSENVAPRSVIVTPKTTPTQANRHALRRRLERVAADLDRRGQHDEAAVARYFLAGIA